MGVKKEKHDNLVGENTGTYLVIHNNKNRYVFVCVRGREKKKRLPGQ
jgi:hypothetical protein